MSEPNQDWAYRKAQRFYLTYAKLCQGPNADRASVAKWLRALAAAFREMRGKKRKEA